MVTYVQAFADWSYLWSIGPAYDMTGRYVDQEDLDKLLRSPTKTTARRCLVSQIEYWFYAGPALFEAKGVIDWSDPRIVEIAWRHGIPQP